MKASPTLLSLALLGFSQSVTAGDLDWLIGCWETPDQTAREVWVEEPDGGLIGFSVTLEAGRVGFYEVLRITMSTDGTVSYTAHPVGQPTATFQARRVSGNEVTFSNASHDYPQEISYKREGTLLSATISALNGKNPRSFRKQACD